MWTMSGLHAGEMGDRDTRKARETERSNRFFRAKNVWKCDRITKDGRDTGRQETSI
jgi:hypothetical protein